MALHHRGHGMHVPLLLPECLRPEERSSWSRCSQHDAAQPGGGAGCCVQPGISADAAPDGPGPVPGGQVLPCREEARAQSCQRFPGCARPRPARSRRSTVPQRAAAIRLPGHGESGDGGAEQLIAQPCSLHDLRATGAFAVGVGEGRHGRAVGWPGILRWCRRPVPRPISAMVAAPGQPGTATTASADCRPCSARGHVLAGQAAPLTRAATASLPRPTPARVRAHTSCSSLPGAALRPDGLPRRQCQRFRAARHDSAGGQ